MPLAQLNSGRPISLAGDSAVDGELVAISRGETTPSHLARTRGLARQDRPYYPLTKRGRWRCPMTHRSDF
jgi:hypothetical protein